MQKKGKTPVFLGINLQTDDGFKGKLSQLFTNVFSQAGEPKTMIQEFQHMVETSSQSGGWKFPNDYHVTTLFIGGNKQRLRAP